MVIVGIKQRQYKAVEIYTCQTTWKPRREHEELLLPFITKGSASQILAGGLVATGTPLHDGFDDTSKLVLQTTGLGAAVHAAPPLRTTRLIGLFGSIN